MNEGKVYFVSAPGRIKIGFTRRPERRLLTLRRADMEELSVIAIIDGSRFLEKTLHAILKNHRVRGEWFADCAVVRAEIESARAGKYPLEAEVVIPSASMAEEEKISPEFEMLTRLGDDAEEAIARGADKYEVRGRVDAFLAATQLFIERRDRQLGDKGRALDRGK